MIKSEPTAIVILSGSWQRFTGSATFGSLLMQYFDPGNGLILQSYPSMHWNYHTSSLGLHERQLCLSEVLQNGHSATILGLLAKYNESA
mgnify:CR=1 FL=1